MSILQLCYVISAILFILGIRSLSSPETARRGMNFASVGMLIAIIGTLFNHQIVSYVWIIAGIVLGTVLSLPISLWIPMTKIPQRIALSHAGGALAACLIGVAEYYRYHASLSSASMGIIAVEVMLGALTFTGSLMVAGKLHGVLPSRPITYKGQNIVNISLFVVMAGIVIYLMLNPETNLTFYVLLSLSFLFGIFLVTPIGAADMPVVIAVFNSYGGLTGAVMGFMLANRIQIVTGALDGASGFILSILMCKAMNRSITNVLFGAFGKMEEEHTKKAYSPDKGEPQSISVEEVLPFFEQAKSVIIAPGYGMAASQAHHALREFADKLKANGVNVKYAIHPVAGRMPGHMNVLLAEANVPYTDLFDMDEINPEFPHADIALVVGANDVTNPAARTVKSSPIYGMPILDVDKAKKVIVLKRSMSPGFSGVENELYHKEHTFLLFGDAKESLTRLAYGFKRAWGG
ncbi:NAD(P) transhydrogenase subunit beta [Aquicella siphonis]|uniref:NAD(P) transhydrogenase subunit beta n=1 Tax=Aquicella siphonis TaxID=254247 RepID=A0A5E4PJU2_9COXI|nr:NAD(P)(+) transhydrogenase (Re/Si-specific) subunit beta [Aquicella siphonis]VVC77244.1 NAD(P) transhydrogenase subunit beta [Aquicella siphonis]